MKTNKQLALDFLQKSLKSTPGEIQSFTVSWQNAEKLVEIASKEQWYYPSKGEICTTLNTRIIIVTIENYDSKDNNYPEEAEVVGTSIHRGHSTMVSVNNMDECCLWSDVVAWKYFPTFEETI